MDLRDLTSLYDDEGPFVTIYLDTPSDVEDAAEMLETKWKNTLRELETLGVDDATRSALSEARGAHGEGQARVLVAASGRVLLARSLQEMTPEQVRLNPLPQLLPMLRAEQPRLPHMLVLADRTGADIRGYIGTDDRPDVEAEAGGDGYPIRKVKAGGWSMRHYYHRAENTWESNAGDAAHQIERMARDVAPRVIVAAGDTRALQLIPQHLPEQLQPLWTVVSGSRHADGSEDLVEEERRKAVEDRHTGELTDLLARYAQERGQADLACEGLADTVDALRKAQVDTLLLTEDVDEDSLAWFGPDPTSLALSHSELTTLGVDSPREAPVLDVLLRAAAGTGATVRIVPGGLEQAPKDGVGALLRYATPDAGAAPRS